VNGSFLEGLFLDSDLGVISGTPAFAGSYDVLIEVLDSDGGLEAKTLTIEVRNNEASPEKQPAPALHASPAVGSQRVQAHIASAPSSCAPMGPNLDELVNILDAMRAGDWARVNTNLFSDVWTPSSLRPLNGLSNPPPSRIIIPWSSFAWDSKRGDVILYGGGHANYPGNDVYRWRGATRQWERASLPSEITHDDLGNWIAIDGVDAAPSSAHTYDNNVYLPIVDRFLTFGGAAYNNGGAYKRHVDANTSWDTGPYLFDPSKADGNKVGGITGSHVQREVPFPEIVGGNMWENRDIYVNIPGNPPLPGSFVNGATAYAEVNAIDVVYVSARRGGSTALDLYKYTINDIHGPAQDTWEQVGRFFHSFGDQGNGAYDPVLNIFVRTGGNQFTYWDLNTPGPTNNNVLFTPEDLTREFVLTRLHGMDYDPVRHQYALWDGSGVVWMMKPPEMVSATGWSVTKQPSPASEVPNGDTGTGILGKWKYIPNLDAFIGLQDPNQGNIWLYKPVGWQYPSEWGSQGDTDGDCMPDRFELDHGLNPLDPSDAALDTDGDGLTNLEEFYRIEIP
jgi:hypothetical protein